MDEAEGTETVAALDFGRWMQTRREALDLTRAALAALVGCARITITKIEHGERRPSRQVAERLADALAIPAFEQAAFVAWARGIADAGLPPVPPFAPAPPAAPAESGEAPAPTPPDNLPATPSSFLGREHDVAQVRGLLWRADVRLVTLTGPPGIGKTRLSLAVATLLCADFAHGVWFVPLAALRDPALVAATIAQTLSLKERPDQPVAELLRAHLRDKQLLLVLDNFEQVVPAAPLLADLLAAAPQLKILVTSRAVLHIYGECEFPVPPLALPDLGALPPPDLLAHVAGVALFVQRTQAVQPAFMLTPENAPLVAALCVRLEGLPLAIELAAARSKVFPPAALLARLDRRLALLVGGPQDRTPRQQTLRGAIAWSYDLLDAAERTLFCRLAVFVGGWTLAAAEAVAEGLADGGWVLGVRDTGSGVRGQGSMGDAIFPLGSTRPLPTPTAQRAPEPPTPSVAVPTPTAQRAPEPPTPGVLDLLESLANKSLVQITTEADPRFTMLETIREYAGEQLAASGEASALRRQHAAYFLELSEQAGPEVRRANQQYWVARLEAEHDNLRAALAWSQTAEGDPQVGVRIAGALSVFWYYWGYYREGRAWLETTLAGAGPARTAARAKALLGAAQLAFWESDYATARIQFSEAETIFRELGDKAGRSTARRGQAFVASYTNDDAVVRPFIEESLALAREVGDPAVLAPALVLMGGLLRTERDYPGAQAVYDECLALYRQLGDQAGVAFLLPQMTALGLERGDYAEVRALGEECLTLSRALGMMVAIPHTLLHLGQAARREGDLPQARAWYEQCLVASDAAGNRDEVAWVHLELCYTALQQDDAARAAGHLRAAIRAFQETGRKNGLAQCLLALAGVALAQNQPAQATRLFGTLAALELAGSGWETVDTFDYDRILAQARASLDDAAWEAAWTAGQALSLEEALAEGLAYIA